MKRDFSDSAYEELIGLVNQVENEKWSKFTDSVGDTWYSFQSWIGTLDIEKYLDDVNEYHKKVIDKNDTTKEQLDKIFDDVKSADKTYASRFVGYKTTLKQFKGLVEDFIEAVSPQNATINSDKLPDMITQYQTAKKYLQIQATDGLTEEDFEEMDEITMATILEGTADSWEELFPDVKVGEKIEVPLGPNTVLYYSVASTVKGDSDFTIDAVAEEQQIKLKGVSYSAASDEGLSVAIKAESDKMSIDAGLGGAMVTVISTKDKFGASVEIENGSDTYKVKTETSTDKLVIEESIKTETEGGSVTTAVGIEISNNTDWTTLPAVEYEVATSEIPPLNDVEWEEIDNTETVKETNSGSDYKLNEVEEDDTTKEVVESIGKGVVVGTVLFAGYELVKWGIAIAAAIPTGGASMVVAGVTP